MATASKKYRAAPGVEGVSVWAHILLALGGIVMVGPLIWMILTSLKTGADAESFFSTPHKLTAIIRAMFPDPLTWENYKAVFSERPMLRYFLNSGLYTVLRIIPSLFFCSLAG